MKSIFARIMLVFLFIFLLGACGCQQTPERAAVVYGRDLMKKIEEPAASFEFYNASSSWQETLDMKGSDTKVEINASISVPDVMAFPVYKVEYIEFDISRIEFLVDYFAKGKDVTGYTEPTKADLEIELLLAKKNDDAEMVAEIEEMIDSAPEYIEAEIITDWNVESLPNGHFTEDDGIEASIIITPDSFMYMKGFVMANSILEMNSINVKNDIMILEKDAVAAAQDLLHELDIDYMVDVELEKAQYFSSVADAHIESGEKLLAAGYLIKFARNVDGIPGITNHFSLYRGSEVIHYSAPLYPEEIQIFVDENGEPKSFYWQHPLDITDCLNENVALLEFDDVQDRIRDMLTFVNSYDGEPVIVTDIELNMTIISLEDQPDEAMYVPAWFVYYTMEFDDYIDEGDEVRVERSEQEFAIAINAIDGGRIAELPVDIYTETEDDAD